MLERGRGCEVWDVAGTRYLDMTAGIAVCGLGHGAPGVHRAHDRAARQARPRLEPLLQRSADPRREGDRRSVVRRRACSSATPAREANEGALKLARRYQAVVAGAPQRIDDRLDEGSFHGRSFATVAVTGQPKYREGLGRSSEPVEYIPYGDLEAATRALEAAHRCAIIVEPIQAEGGIIVPPPGYLAGLRRLCDDTGTILIFDEVQTGVGRTGTWFGYQHDNVTPDVMTLAKGLGGGVPIGAVA